MPITVEIITQDVSLSLSWRSWTIEKGLGQPDTLSQEINELDDAVHDLLGPTDNVYYVQVRKNTTLLFSGLIMKLHRENNHGRVTYTLDGVSWAFLAPRRLVGRPDGTEWLIQEDDDPERLPTAVAIDPSAIGAPTVTAIQDLFAAYWIWPAIDTTTYVFPILPDLAPVEQITWSGSDVDGAMNDMTAAGSAAARWWITNDSPDPQDIEAPNLALHVANIVLPDDGDDGDDIRAGYPSEDFPVAVAPYAISDTPVEGVSIMATSTPDLDVSFDQRRGAVFVRGATGYTEEVVPSGGPLPYAIGDVIEGGTGWVGAPGTPWGEAYVDAPAAITPTQRDAFGLAYRGGYDRPSVSGTIKVDGYDGWDQGQLLQITDAGLGLDGHWVLIMGVSISANDPMGESLAYVLTVGDVLKPDVAYELRQQRLKEARKEIAPATQFIAFVGDLTLAPGETAPLTMQLANAANKSMAVKGVGAVWHLLLNGADVTDVEDTGGAFYLSDLVEVTDEMGQVTATLHAGAGATAADACKPWAAMVP